ncbi:hypothetical protein [Mesorhizobium sp. B2-9-1]|uniref:hypothetical protein n=1 Tax=Mesorhizobium sp. B2-9-1 TaxID=2589898 RepID=UPI0015E42679|nr:hypothetical protein [Mesorhizobium sp. B2-9-1]
MAVAAPAVSTNSACLESAAGSESVTSPAATLLRPPGRSGRAGFFGLPPARPPLGLAKPMALKPALRWTMPIMALRETGLPRSALKRPAMREADSPSFSKAAISSISFSV